MNQRIQEHRQSEFAIVVLDVNGLKKINDTEGHEAADKRMYENKSSLKMRKGME